MTTKQEFLKKLETYLDIELSAFDKVRVEGYLDEYVGSIPPKIEIREVIQFKDRYSSLEPCADGLIESEGKKICKEFGVTYTEFIRPKSGKSTTLITEVRKIFCHRMIKCFNASRNQLIDYFNVDHTTVCYYINGKKSRPQPIKQTA